MPAWNLQSQRKVCALRTHTVSAFQMTSILFRGRLTTHTEGEGHTTFYEYGKDGVRYRFAFEYIKEPNGSINHRLFRPNK